MLKKIIKKRRYIFIIVIALIFLFPTTNKINKFKLDEDSIIKNKEVGWVYLKALIIVLNRLDGCRSQFHTNYPCQIYI